MAGRLAGHYVLIVVTNTGPSASLSDLHSPAIHRPSQQHTTQLSLCYFRAVVMAPLLSCIRTHATCLLLILASMHYKYVT